MIPSTLRRPPSRQALEIDWSDGSRSSLSAQALRAACRCATCRQAMRARAVAEVSATIELTGIEPYGANAVHLAFSDGHARGIYPFAYLRALAEGSASAEEHA